MSPLAALVLDWILTALWPIVGKSGAARYSVPLFLEAGMVLGFLSMAPWLFLRGGARKMFSAELAPPLVMMASFSGAASLIYVYAVQFTTPANAGIMAQVEVLYSGLLCAWLLGEAISGKQVLASILVMGGTGLILAHDLASPRWKGDLMILATPWMFQVSHIFAKRLPPGLDPVLISAARVFYGALVFFPVAAWSALHGGDWTWSASGLGLLLFQGIGLSALNLVLWYMAILRMDLAKATAFLLSYPALTLLFSWAMGREAVSAQQVAGLAVTLAGAFWLSRLAVEIQRKAVVATPVSGGIAG